MVKPKPISFTPMWEGKKICGYRVVPKGGKNYILSPQEVRDNPSPHQLTMLIRERDALGDVYRNKVKLKK